MHVRISQLLISLLADSSLQSLRDVMGLQDEHVHESSFSMMKMAGQCNVACLLGEVHQIGHELAVEENGREIGLLNVELPLLDRRDDGLRERLRILFLNARFDIGTVYLLGGRVVLFVFVKDDRVRRSVWQSQCLMILSCSTCALPSSSINS